MLTTDQQRQVRRLEGTISTMSENAKAWSRDGFPNCAATAWKHVGRMQERLRELDPDNEMLEVRPRG